MPASNPDTPRPVGNYDALLLLSFGGPEQPDDVVPFLRRVTEGKGIPDERLAEVGQHYFLFGGRSPINDQNRSLIDALERKFAASGMDLPIIWGNRNWDPLLVPALAAAVKRGFKNLLVLTTSAYSSYSGCRQYRENLAAAVAELGDAGAQLHLDKVSAYYDLPEFIEATVAQLEASCADVDPQTLHSSTRLVFVTHSIPTDMNDSSGPAGGGYVAQHEQVSRAVVSRAAEQLGWPQEAAWDLVYCSRSGPPHQPWLEPDVNDHLEQLYEQGIDRVICVPIGFISDHMEVIYDLDTEASATAERLGLGFIRVPTVGVHDIFVSGLARQLAAYQAAASDADPAEAESAGTQTDSALRAGCAAHCCPNPRGERPALCQGRA